VGSLFAEEGRLLRAPEGAPIFLQVFITREFRRLTWQVFVSGGLPGFSVGVGARLKAAATNLHGITLLLPLPLFREVFITGGLNPFILQVQI